MKPLLAVALGLVIIALYARAGDHDLLADPAGWALALVGLKVLGDRVDLPFRRPLWALGLSALAASAVLVVPDARDWFEDADPALGWAVDVPALAFCGLLCQALVAGARTAGATAAAGWLQWTALGFVVAILAPIVVIGGDVDALRGPAEAVTGLTQLSLFVLCLVHSGRVWAGAPQTEQSAT